MWSMTSGTRKRGPPCCERQLARKRGPRSCDCRLLDQKSYGSEEEWSQRGRQPKITPDFLHVRAQTRTSAPFFLAVTLMNEQSRVFAPCCEPNQPKPFPKNVHWVGGQGQLNEEARQSLKVGFGEFRFKAGEPSISRHWERCPQAQCVDGQT